MKLIAFRIDRKYRECRRACGVKNLGVYSYAPCRCGCTVTRGIGVLLWWCGIRLDFGCPENSR